MLDSIGKTDNTILIFTADNGPKRDAYDGIQNFDHHISAPIRGLKRDIYEGGHHISFMVLWPGRMKAGTTSEEVTSQVDILKTLASLIGTQLPSGLGHDSPDFFQHWLGDLVFSLPKKVNGMQVQLCSRT